MKLIIGLGNPGRAYADTKHNIGFSIVKALSQTHKIPLKKDSGTFSLSGRGKIEGQNVILAIPLTFMNLSGIAIGSLRKIYKIDLINILVVCDDLDLGFGRIKIRHKGSSGGHRGLKSIIDSLRSEDFWRLRIGIGRPILKDNIDVAGYVLSPFNKKEKDQVKEIIGRACDCCRAWVAKGIVESMNIFNMRSKDNE